MARRLPEKGLIAAAQQKADQIGKRWVQQGPAQLQLLLIECLIVMSRRRLDGVMFWMVCLEDVYKRQTVSRSRGCFKKRPRDQSRVFRRRTVPAASSMARARSCGGSSLTSGGRTRFKKAPSRSTR